MGSRVVVVVVVFPFLSGRCRKRPQEAALTGVVAGAVTVDMGGVVGIDVLAEYCVGAVSPKRLEQIVPDSVDGDRPVGGVGEGEGRVGRS